MDKQIWHIHTMEYYLALKRNEILIHSIMDELENTLSEIRQTQKATY